MHNRPVFSIVIPTYNREKHIAKAIRSALLQDFNSFEVIVVDDGSTDNTEAVVRSINDPRLRYYKKQNGERAAARNFGVKQSVGDFVTFLDSDDLLKTDHLSTANSFISRNSPSVFHIGYDIVNSNGEILYPWTPLPNPANQKLLDGNYLSCLGVFIRRDIMLEHNFNEDRNLSGSEDYELWLRISSRYEILTLPASTAQLVQHDERSVIQVNPEKLIDRINLLRHYLMQDMAFVSKFHKRIKKWSAYLDIYIALHMSLQKETKDAAPKFMVNSFFKSPSVIFSKRFWVIPIKILFN